MSYLQKALDMLPSQEEPHSVRHELDGDTNPLGVELTRFFKQALSEIQTAYIPGMMDHIRRKHPDIQEQMDKAEEFLERIWIEARRGKTDIVEFRKSVEMWRDVILQTLHEHRAMNIEECRARKPDCSGVCWIR